jgi:NCS1 family nucleobase:cation symporter-1
MDPVPPHQRTWSTLNYVAYWVSDATSISSWQLASSMLAVGLSWKQALPAIAVGHGIIAVNLDKPIFCWWLAELSS